MLIQKVIVQMDEFFSYSNQIKQVSTYRVWKIINFVSKIIKIIIKFHDIIDLKHLRWKKQIINFIGQCLKD